MSKQNNKGNLKRRRCTSCGQFVGEHHVCAKSIELELQVNEPLGILYKIPDASVAVSPRHGSYCVRENGDTQLAEHFGVDGLFKAYKNSYRKRYSYLLHAASPGNSSAWGR